MTIKIKINNNEKKNLLKKIGIGIFSSILCLSFVYAYFFIAITFDIVERKNLENKVALSVSKLSDLELEYLHFSDSLTLEKAKTLGFVEIEEPVFANKKSQFVIVSKQDDF